MRSWNRNAKEKSQTLSGQAGQADFKYDVVRGHSQYEARVDIHFVRIRIIPEKIEKLLSSFFALRSKHPGAK